jgi:hypothetical protein
MQLLMGIFLLQTQPVDGSGSALKQRFYVINNEDAHQLGKSTKDSFRSHYGANKKN